MDIKEFALDVMKTGGSEFKSFEALRSIYQEYSANEDKLQTVMDALQATLTNLSNYSKMIQVEEMQEVVSELRLMVLRERHQDELELLGIFQEDVTELLVAQSLIQTTIDFLLENFIDDSEFEAEDFEESDEDDSEEYQGEEPDEDDIDWNEPDENGEILLYTINFNPILPEYLQRGLSTYLEMCSEMYIEELVKKQEEQEAEEAQETEPNNDPALEGLADLLFGAEGGKFSGSLELASTQQDEDLEDDEDYNKDDDFPREFQGN